MTQLFIIKKLKQRDKKAFEQIYRSYVKLIFHIIYEIIGNYEECRDLTQETFVLLMEHLDNIDASRNIKYYLITTAKSLAFKYLKRAEMFQGLSAAVMEISEIEEKKLKDFDTLVKQLEKTLTNEEIKIIIYKFKFNLHFKEIAAITGMSTNAVSSKYTRIRNKIKKTLKIDDFYQ